MGKNTVRAFKWIWAWRDEAEEKWLAEMSQKGLHFKSFGFAGFYTFVKGEPRNYMYRLDFQINTKREEEANYLQLFKDAGWEKVGDYLSWYYFRKEARQGETEEIFSDVDSRRAKYKRLLNFLLVAGPGSIFSIMMPLWDNYKHPWMIGFQIFGAAIILFYIYAFIRLGLKIRQMKKL